MLAQLPNVACGPVGERAQFADNLASGESEVGDLFKLSAAARLLAP
jgi:hypothetical protein